MDSATLVSSPSFLAELSVSDIGVAPW
jgi:hypothetical protein